MSTNRNDDFRSTDRFDVQQRIGSGGMGVVYLAFDHQREERVAIKTLRHVDANAIYRLKHEFRAMTELSHPRLAALHELFCIQEQWFFTMEFVEGVDILAYVRTGGVPAAMPERTTTAEETQTMADSTSLQTVSDDNDAGTLLPDQDLIPPPPSSDAQLPRRHVGRAGIGCIEVTRLRNVILQLAEGVQWLHQAGKLHRDLKPSNVLVTSSARVVILDFGLTTELLLDARSSTTDGMLVGTIPYMSPEQAAGKDVTAASDWYSVGTILYEALTGRLPFIGRPLQMLTDKQLFNPPAPEELIDGVPSDLSSLCIRLLSRNPQSRPGGDEILQILRCSEPESPAAAAPTTTKELFVGRETPLAELTHALRDVQRGRSIAVFVEGESGSGKTALAEEFLRRARRTFDAVTLVGRCHENESVPYKALDSLVDVLSHYLVRLPHLEADALMPRDVEPLSRLFPVLRRVEAMSNLHGRGRVPQDKQELRERAFAALRELFSRLANRTTLILHIDDLQWSDQDSISLLRDLLRPPGAPQLLLLLCQRKDSSANLPALRALLETENTSASRLDVRTVDLEPLNDRDAHQLASALLGQDHLASESVVESVVAGAAGNPYFLESLVRHYQMVGSPPPGTSASAVFTWEQVLLAQIAALREPARRLLNFVAVAGHGVCYRVAARATGLAGECSDALCALRAEKLMRAPGTTGTPVLETYHDRIRELVVAHLSPEEQGHIHRRLAEAMEASGDSDPATLAAHFVAGKEIHKGGEYYLRAACQASEALAFDQAAELYRRAGEIGCDDASLRRQLRWKTATALANAGRGAEAGAEYAAAANGATPQEALEARRLSAMQFLFSGEVDQGLAMLETVLADVGLQLSRGPRHALWNLVRQRARLRLRGLRFRIRGEDEVDPKLLQRIDICWSVAAGLSIIDPIAAAGFQTRGLLLALRSGEPNRIARSLCIEAAHASIAGGAAKRRVELLLERAETLSCRLDNPHVRGLIQLARGVVALGQGRWRAATEFCDKAESTFREQCTGVAWELDCAAACATSALLDAGEIAELAQRLPLLRDRARKRGNLLALTAPSSMNLPELAADDPDSAQRNLAACMRHWPHKRFYVQHLSALYDQVQTDLYRADPEGAWRRIARRQGTIARSMLMRVQLSRAYAYQTRARCALAMADMSTQPQPMLRVAVRDARRVEREGQAWTLPLAELVYAAVAASRGQKVQAITLLEKATVHFDRVDMVLYAAVARRRLGQLVGGRSGADLIQLSEDWMASQQVVHPDRFTDVFAPGFSARGIPSVKVPQKI